MCVALAGATLAQEHEAEENPLKRNKLAVFLGNSIIHGVHNTQTGKEQYEVAPIVGLDYESWLNHRWAIGTYNEFTYMSIEVQKNEAEFIKRENVVLFSGVVDYEVMPGWTLFAGTGIEADAENTLWIGNLGTEYAFIRHDNWEVAASANYIYKEYYGSINFGIVIGKRFGKTLAHHRVHEE